MMLTDLHCHLLPGVDDGPPNIEEALDLLEFEIEEGVGRIALTGHFDCEKETIDHYLDRARIAADKLRDRIEDRPDLRSKVELKLAAEVRYSPRLIDIDTRKLCIDGTDYLLLELPFGAKPFQLYETICGLQMHGCSIIFAHVERYGYLMNDPTMLYKWIDEGSYAQANASSVYRGDRLASHILKLIDWDLIQIIASDAHGTVHRKPDLKKGLEAVERRLGEDVLDRLMNNAEDVFCGETLDVPDIYCPRKVFGKWR